jgi:hypothetical protein
MALPNVFTQEVSDQIIDRIHRLNPNSVAQWGKMNVAQMLAHCNVTYEMMYEQKHPQNGAFMKFILKMLVKPKVVNETTYPKNSRTAPAFVMADEKHFEEEKQRLIAYINKTQALGGEHFDQMESHSFGKLTTIEWNNMMYKHLNHHLTQFGV